jgi:hypothetical protein
LKQRLSFKVKLFSKAAKNSELKEAFMTDIEIVGQVISVIAMTCIIFSFQQKKQSYLITLQLVGGALFSVSYFMLGAVVGGVLNVVATVRAVIFLFSKKLKTSHPVWLVGFIGLYAVLYALTFTLFGVEPTPIAFVVELLPIVGMIASTVGFVLNNSKAVRRLGLVSSPAWLTYNLYYRSAGAVICEVISLISIFVGMYRHDRKPR